MCGNRPPAGRGRGACRCNIFADPRGFGAGRKSEGTGSWSKRARSFSFVVAPPFPSWRQRAGGCGGRLDLPEGRRRMALPKLPASISFRGVELAFNNARDTSATRPGVRATTEKRSRGRAPNRRPSKYAQAWAYSSIGQSPRLITGLFLVRTQVGPLTPSSWQM